MTQLSRATLSQKKSLNTQARFSAPEAFVLFGGLTKSGDLIMKPVKEALEKNILSIYRGKVRVLISELKESDAAVLGASALGWEVKPLATPQ